MGNAIASWRERRPISVALLQSTSERGVRAAMADPSGLVTFAQGKLREPLVARSVEGIVSRSEIRNP
jgi:hypothetical protein